MSEQNSDLDLELWLDKDIVSRQNALKNSFWDILSDTANAFSPAELKKIHQKSRGTKLTRGNNLEGFSYQVLDICRDFDKENGLNIRVLNWFGHGLFLFILLGENHSSRLEKTFIEEGFQFCLSKSEWDYVGIIHHNLASSNLTAFEVNNAEVYQWMLQLTPNSDSIKTTTMLVGKIKKVFNLLSSNLG